MSRSWKLILSGAALLAVTGGVLAYRSLVGFPLYFAGHYVSPKVTWYEVGPPPVLIYPGEVYFGYRNARGQFVRHGPYIRRIWQSTPRHPWGTLRTAETGTYMDGERDGVFLEYQTYWDKLIGRTAYVRGRQVRVEYPLFHIPPIHNPSAIPEPGQSDLSIIARLVERAYHNKPHKAAIIGDYALVEWIGPSVFGETRAQALVIRQNRRWELVSASGAYALASLIGVGVPPRIAEQLIQRLAVRSDSF